MSTSSQVSLGSLRLQTRQRGDMVNNQAVSDPELNQYISQSYKELQDILVSAYGNEYELANTYRFVTNNNQSYPLPDGSPNFVDTTGSTASKFYKLLGVDLQYSASPTGYVTLRRFEFIERNKYAYPNTTTNWNGYTNLRYRVQGDGLYFVPLPTTGQTVQVWYIPAPTSLQFILPCTTTLNSRTITLLDTTGLSPGMNVYGDGIQANATISSMGSTSVIVSSSVTATYSSAILSFWSDSTVMEGISGWEEYVIVDAAIKMQIKQDLDYSGLAAQKLGLKTRIEAMAEGRDAGQAQHVSDVLGAASYGNGGFGGAGDGWGWY